MPRFAAATAFMLLASLALAAQAADPQAITPEGWGITFNLPGNGDVALAGDEGMEDGELAFLWQVVSDNPMADPVYQIDGSTIEGDDPEAPMTAEAFEAFYGQMVEDLGSDEKFTVIGTVENEQHAGRRWQVFDLREKQAATDDEGKEYERVINYLSYFALDGEELRLVNFYYEANENGNAPTGVAEIVNATLGA
jgi:hypothetical protein